MNREAILAEIRQLEAQKRSNPQFAHGLNDQITKLCDRLKGAQDFEPRKVV
jgi:hypothetical protein